MSENTTDLHDMGGAIGPASDRTARDKDSSAAAAGSVPEAGYAQEVEGYDYGYDPRDSSIAGSDQGGNSIDPPVAGARSEYLSIDGSDDPGQSVG